MLIRINEQVVSKLAPQIVILHSDILQYIVAELLRGRRPESGVLYSY